ncbi:MAG: Late competence development protein ComFB [Firmicutes bacterium]|nr:Late competence development protein ComFB [Bacillota bacterium]
MQLKNYMEDLVWQRLDEVLINDPETCNCEKCRYDIVSLALNSLPPRYIVTPAGEAYTKTKALESQFNIDIITAITKAFQVVQNNPRHDSKQA